jgi:hypothetical protein
LPKIWAAFIPHARSSFGEAQPIRPLIAGRGNAEIIHQFEEEIGAASSENGVFIAKMEFSVRTGLFLNLSVVFTSHLA